MCNNLIYRVPSALTLICFDFVALRESVGLPLKLANTKNTHRIHTPYTCQHRRHLIMANHTRKEFQNSQPHLATFFSLVKVYKNKILLIFGNSQTRRFG